MNNPEEEAQSTQPDKGLTVAGIKISRELVVGAVSFVVFITLLTIFIDRVGLSELQDAVADAGPLAPLAYMSIKAATYVFAPLTSGPIQLSAGLIFGIVPGTLYTLMGEVIGGSISFWIARRFGRPVVYRLVGNEGMMQVDKFYHEHMGGWLSLFIARIVLFSFWDFLSYAAGLAPVRFRVYFFVSLIAGFFPTILFVGLGTAMGQSTESLFIGYGLIAVVIVLTLLFRKPIQRLMNVGRPPADTEDDAGRAAQD